jgi:CheY-like chemotaxis protein
LARKILLADDSVTAQNMGRKILTDAGYEVVTVNNGSAALKKIAEGKPDLIVLDVYMPGYSGLEVCQRIKENRETARIPILLTVGKLEPFKPEEARRARADAFVVKPFEASELLSALTKLEDKIIPGSEPYKQGRFAKAVASVDQEGDGEKFGDSEGGWKARLRIPTGKPKDTEPAPDYAATQGKGFRDYVEPSAQNAPPPPPQPSAVPERSLPTGIPHDITPEEIAAITAAAAQLSGNGVPPLTHPHTDSVEAVVEHAEPQAAQESSQDSAPVTFASSPAITDSTESAGDVESAAIAHASPEPEAAATEENVTPDRLPEIPSVAASPAVREELPVSPAAEATEMPAEAVVEVAPVPVADAPQSPAATAAIGIPDPMSEAVPAAPPEAVPQVALPGPAVANASDDEVMAALQTLIPSSENTTSVAVDSPSNGAGTSFPAHSAHPRWVAEQVSLAAGEATISLEQEMAVAYGTFSGQAAHAAENPRHHASASQPETAAPTLAQEPSEPHAMQAMASAAGCGEGVPVYSSAAPQNSLESSAAAPAAESVHPATETCEPGAAPAEQVAKEFQSIEGEVMAANWKNIRDSIAGAAAQPALAKEDFREVEPTTSGQASTADQTASKLKASDPTAIANIVDSVLAELRPKIVEEIARKLADPKKE